MPYLGIYTTLLILGTFSSDMRGARRLFYFTALAGLFIFSAFRFQVGCDWTGYLYNYEQQMFLTFSEAFQRRNPAYWGVLSTMYEFNLSYPYLNVVTSAIYFLGFHALAKRQPDPLGMLVLSFPVLIINMPMSAVKQAAAIGLLCFAFNALCDRKPVAYVAWVGIAGLFHSSAWAFMALAPFTRWPFNQSTVIVSVVLALPGAYFLLADTFEVYSDRYIQTERDALGGPFRGAMLAVTGIFFLMFLKESWRERYPVDYNLAVMGSYIMLAVLPVILVSSVIGDRVGYYLMPLQLIVLARIPYLVSGRHAGLLHVAPYVMLGLLLLVWTSLSSHFQKCYLPYQFWY